MASKGDRVWRVQYTLNPDPAKDPAAPEPIDLFTTEPVVTVTAKTLERAAAKAKKLIPDSPAGFALTDISLVATLST
jgi:hypothetical protein